MAALEKLRSKGTLVMIVVFVALACFVIGDFLNNASAVFHPDQDKVGEVYGKKLNYTDFQKEVDAFANFDKIQGTYTSDDKARSEAWQTFTLANVLKNQAEKIGMSITTEELDYATRVNPHAMVQNLRMVQDENGRFSMQNLDMMLKAFKNMEEASDDEKKNNPQYEYMEKLYNSWICVEKQLNNMLLYDKYFRMVASATSAPKAEKEFLSQYDAEAIDYVVAIKSFYGMADSSFTVSGAEAKAKYQEMQKMFKTPARRTIKTIVFDVKPLASDSDEAKNKALSIEKDLRETENAEEAILLAMQESDPSIANKNGFLTKDEVDFSIRDFAFSAKKDSILATFEDGIYYKTAKIIESATNRPDSIKVSCIYLTNAPKKELKNRADSLQKELKNGAKFADLAEKHTMDTRSKSEKGSFGWISEGQFSRLKDFDSKSFTAKEGEVFEMEDRGEYFIFKVDSVSKTTSPKVKIAEVAVKIESNNDTYRKRYEAASRYLSDNNTIEKFTENAEAQGLYVQEYPIFEDASTVGNIENGRKIVNWAFNEKRKLGDIVAQPFQSPNQCVIVALTEIIEKGYAPYSSKEVKNIVDEAVKNDKKAASIMEEWNGKEISTIAGIDTIRGIRFSTRGANPSIVGALSTLKVDEQSAPIKTNDAVYMVKVLAKTPVESPAVDNNRGRILQSMYNQTFSILMDKADIKDNRSRFF